MTHNGKRSLKLALEQSSIELPELEAELKKYIFHTEQQRRLIERILSAPERVSPRQAFSLLPENSSMRERWKSPNEWLFDQRRPSVFTMMNFFGDDPGFLGVFGRNIFPEGRWEFGRMNLFFNGDSSDYYKRIEWGFSQKEEGFLAMEEAKFMEDIFLDSSVDIKVLEQRQKLLGALSSFDRLPDLTRAKNESYRLINGSDNLYRIYPQTRDDEIMEEGELAIHAYHRGEKRMRIIGEYGMDHGHMELRPLMEQSVKEIKRGQDAMQRFVHLLRQVPCDMAKQIAAELGGLAIEAQKVLKTNDLLSRKKDGKKRDNVGYIWEFMAHKLEPQLLSLGSIVEFANIIKSEGWKEVSLDDDSPPYYKGGWNMKHPKEGQTPNDSLGDTPSVVLSSANGSGKTYKIESDAATHLAAQSLGFAPVTEGNFHRHDSFAMIKRGRDDFEANLSTFMNEMRRWLQALTHLGQRPRVYLDEGCSGTSPRDGASLMAGFCGYVTSRGGSVVASSHNELFADMMKGRPDTSIHHFESFRLLRGFGDSKFIDLAEAKGFSESAISLMRAWLEGDSSLPEIPTVGQKFPKVLKYSDVEREGLKRQASTLDSLFPQKSENSLLHLASSDTDFSQQFLLGKVDFRLKSPTPTFLWQNAAELDNKKMIHNMIINAPALSSQERLERGRMFAELIKEGRFATINELSVQLYRLEEGCELIAKHLGQINLGLNPFASDDGSKDHDVDIGRAIAFMDINLKWMGDRCGFEALRAQFQEFVEDERAEFQKHVNDDFFSDVQTDQSKKKALIDALKQAIRDLPAMALSDVDLEAVQHELEILDGGGGEGLKKIGYFTRLNLAEALLERPRQMAAFDGLLKILRQADSVHLHQVANHLSLIFESLLGANANNTGSFANELARLNALCAFADLDQQQGFCMAEFNDTGEIEIDEGIALFADPKTRKPNGLHMGGDKEGVRILASPNGSGKTFNQKQNVLAILIALATGRAPAKRANLPQFDGLLYADRIAESTAEDTSAGEEELMCWLKSLFFMEGRKAVFGAVDEIGSTTSPKYQEAFMAFVVSQFMRRGDPLVLSTHHHGAVDRFLAMSDKIKAWHFDFELKDGKIIFNRTLKSGHEGSYGIELARTMKVPEEILAFGKNVV